MTAEEIKNRKVPANSEFAVEQFQGEMLQEIAYQLAVFNERNRALEIKHKATETQAIVRSGVRRTSGHKRFFVKHWGLEAGESELADFTPLAGKLHWQDLGVGQTTVGRLGTREDAEITRRF